MEKRSERIFLAFVLIELLVLYAPTAQWLFDRWTLSVWHHAHGIFIPPVTTYLAWKELRACRHLPTRSSAWGFLLLVPALALHALDAGLHTQLLSAVSVVVALPGLSLIFLGTERTKAIAFPLAFLVFMLPIPLAVTEQVHLQLRYIVTAGLAVIIPQFGVPVYIEETTLFLPTTSLQVGDACSGFSTLYAMGAMACLTAYLSPHPLRRILVLLVAAPAAIGANLVRATILVMLVVWQGIDVLETILHPLTGVLAFVLAITVILNVGRPVSRIT